LTARGLRRAVVALLLATPIIPSSAASAAPITACTITADNPEVYPLGSTLGPNTTTFTIDTSASIVGTDWYLWAIGTGSVGVDYMFPIMQTTSPGVISRSHSQLLNDWTAAGGMIISEPYSASMIVTGSSSTSSILCQVVVTAMPNAAPSAPSDVTATPGDGEATLSWTPWKNFDGQTYTATASPGGQSCTAAHPATSCTVAGLDNGTSYTFSVTTTTSGGTSSAATSSPVTPSAGAGSGGDGGSDGDSDLLPATGVGTQSLMSILVAVSAIIAGTSIAAGTRRRRRPGI
jgi:hypothetical protein